MSARSPSASAHCDAMTTTRSSCTPHFCARNRSASARLALPNRATHGATVSTCQRRNAHVERHAPQGERPKLPGSRAVMQRQAHSAAAQPAHHELNRRNGVGAIRKREAKQVLRCSHVRAGRRLNQGARSDLENGAQRDGALPKQTARAFAVSTSQLLSATQRNHAPASGRKCVFSSPRWPPGSGAAPCER